MTKKQRAVSFGERETPHVSNRMVLDMLQFDMFKFSSQCITTVNWIILNRFILPKVSRKYF